MIKIYNEFFRVTDDGKVREKVMVMRTALTVIITIVCLFAMGISAYAYFSYDETSKSNIIKTASFETEISVLDIDSGFSPVDVEKLDQYTHKTALAPNKPYEIRITRAGTASTGFCVISAANCQIEKYHTQQIGMDVNSETAGIDTITFKITASNTTILTFYSHWGTSSQYADYVNKGVDGDLYIVNGEEVYLNIDGGSSISTDDSTQMDNGSDNIIPPETSDTPEVTTPSEEITSPEETTPPEVSTPTETTPPEEEKTPEQTTPPDESASTDTDSDEILHTVAAGESLSTIAAQYDTTVDRIAIYNSIEDIRLIRPGQVLKIPPADWVIPEGSASEDPAASEDTQITDEVTP